MSEPRLPHDISENPLVVLLTLLTGLKAVVETVSEPPEWVKGLSPVNGKRCGPWRGKGSFGKGFGPQSRGRKR